MLESPQCPDILKTSLEVGQRREAVSGHRPQVVQTQRWPQMSFHKCNTHSLLIIVDAKQTLLMLLCEDQWRWGSVP